MILSRTFGHNGVHPDDSKKWTSKKAIVSADIPNIAYIPVAQHLGKSARIIVKEGDIVEEGQLIAEADGFISANVHSSIPGKVIGFEDVYISNGKKSKAIVIELDGSFNKSGRSVQLSDWYSYSAQDLIKIIRDAGIVGLGGATFPSNVKLSVPPDKKIDTLIINSAECEPYLTCDHRLLLDKTEDFLEGISIINKILDVPNIYIGVENNKRDAITRLKALCKNKYDFKIIPLKVKYPQGDEKQLIKAVTNRVVPVGKLPLEVGVVVVNTSTVVAVKEAVVNEKPLIDRVLTVTGSGVREPANLKVRIGTKIGDVIKECGGLTEDIDKVVIGGPMMGFTQMNLDTPVAKGTSGIVCLAKEDSGVFKSGAICINCGKCISACSFGLMPTMINKFILAKKFKEAEDYGIMNCKECGACAWVCPAKISLVQNFRLGKDLVRKLK